MLDVISNKKAEWGKIAKQKKNNLTWNDAKNVTQVQNEMTTSFHVVDTNQQQK